MQYNLFSNALPSIPGNASETEFQPKLIYQKLEYGVNIVCEKQP